MGIEFADITGALKALRARAEQAIAEADRLGQDVRSRRVRLRDEDGEICFEGTLAEAAELRILGIGMSFLLAADVLFSAVGSVAEFAAPVV